MKTLEQIRHTMYLRAEVWWWCAFGLVALGVVSGVLAINTLDASSKMVSYVAATVAALAPILAAFARWRSASFAGRADLCRRAFMYRDALGVELEVEELRRVALWPGKTPLNPVTASEPYFSTESTQGPQRLADAVAESAFYTWELARIMAVVGFGLVGVVALVVYAALGALPVLALEAEALDTLTVVVGVVATVTLALLFGEVLVTALAYKTLSEESEVAARSATQFRNLAAKSNETAMRIAESYSIALAANLPIPNLLYRWNRDRIHLAYKAGTPTRGN